MEKKEKSYQRSKLGTILDERKLTLMQFATMVYEKTGYLIAVTNLSNYCTGLRPIKKIEIAKMFSDTLELQITDIL